MVRGGWVVRSGGGGDVVGGRVVPVGGAGWSGDWSGAVVGIVKITVASRLRGGRVTATGRVDVVVVVVVTVTTTTTGSTPAREGRGVPSGWTAPLEQLTSSDVIAATAAHLIART